MLYRRFVTYEDIAEWVLEGDDVRIVDVDRKLSKQEDITNPRRAHILASVLSSKLKEKDITDAAINEIEDLLKTAYKLLKEQPEKTKKVEKVETPKHVLEDDLPFINKL